MGPTGLCTVFCSVPTPTTTVGLPFLLSSADCPDSFKRPRGERPTAPLIPQLEPLGPRGELRTRAAGPQPERLLPGDLAWGPSTCTPDKCPGHAAPATLRTVLREALPEPFGMLSSKPYRSLPRVMAQTFCSSISAG